MKKMLIFAAILIVLFGAIALVNQSETTEGVSDNQLSSEEQKKQESYYTNKISSDELGKQLDAKTDATVYFYQTSCTHCMKVSPIVVPLAKELGVDMKVLDLQTDQNGWDAFHIEGTPTIVRYKEGKEVSRIVGEQSEDAFKKWFESTK